MGDRHGPDPYLTRQEEEELVQWALKMSEIGYGQTRVQILEMVKRILDNNPRPNPFRDNRPGKDWWYAFLKRHPNISVRVPQALQSCRASACTPDALDRWFVGYEQFILTHGLVDCPECIWNCDESGFPLCPKSGKVIAAQGVRQVYQVTGSSKQQITTLCCISAVGDVIPPMHVFPGERFRYNPLEGSVEGAYFGKSTNGWMTQELFYGWLTGHFAHRIPSQRPVCLLVDGHSSHINLETSKFCDENGILLYCLPPHSSHITQPLDVAFFAPLKQAWRSSVAQFQLDNDGQPVEKQSFARVFRIAYHKAVKLGTIVHAFRASGIYPVDRNAIDSRKLGPSQIYTSHKESVPGSQPTPKPGSLIALKALEDEMDSETIKKFQVRLEEGYDIDSDPLFKAWAGLKRSSQPQPTLASAVEDTTAGALVDITNITKSKPSAVPPELLKLPEASHTKRPQQRMACLPKHLSSKEMISFLEERKMKKIREEEDKAKRKAEREVKRKVREEQKAAKQRQKAKGRGRKAERTDVYICPACKEQYNDDESAIWVECQECASWYHVDCTDIPPEDVRTASFICDLCM